MDPINERQDDVAATGPSQEEQKARAIEARKAMVDNIVTQAQREWSQDFDQMLAEYEVPRRDKVPSFVDRKGDPVTRVSVPWDHLYARMSDDVKPYRSAEADHWYQQWIKGDATRDHALRARASAEIERLFGRAATLEGAGGASGALSDGTGGPLIPRPLEALVNIARLRASSMRRFARKFTMTRQTHTMPTAASMTAHMTAESTTATQGEPTIASVQFTAHKCQAKGIASIELLDDAAINLVNVFSERAGEAIGVVEDTETWRTGTTVTAKISATSYAEATPGALSITDVVAMYYALPYVYRNMGSWFGAANVLKGLTNLRDGNGRLFFQGMQERPAALSDIPGAVGEIMGKPVYEVPMSTGDLLFGDVGAIYTIGDRQGIQVRSSTDRLFDLDQVMWLFTARFDGNNVDTSAGQYCTNVTTFSTV